MRKLLTLIVTILFTITSQNVMAQGSPPPPPGGVNSGPSCWPPSPTCDPSTPVPINEGLVLLLIFGLGFVFIQNKKQLSYKILNNE
jgi:hypothetical protein